MHVAVDHARGEELRLGQLDDVLGPVLRQHGLDLVRVLGHANNSAVLDDDQPVLDELDEARAPRVRVDEAAADRELRRVRRERGHLFFDPGHMYFFTTTFANRGDFFSSPLASANRGGQRGASAGGV